MEDFSLLQTVPIWQTYFIAHVTYYVVLGVVGSRRSDS